MKNRQQSAGCCVVLIVLTALHVIATVNDKIDDDKEFFYFSVLFKLPHCSPLAVTAHALEQ